MTEEELQKRFDNAKPRGLSEPSQPTVPRDHLLGSTGEGRDKGTVATSNSLPIVPGRISGSGDDGTGGSFPAYIVVSGVLKNCTVDGAIGAPV